MKNHIITLTLACACLFVVSCNPETEELGGDRIESAAGDSLPSAAPQVVTDIDTATTPAPVATNVPACDFVGSWLFVEIAGKEAEGPQLQLVLTFNADGTATTTGLGKVRAATWHTEDCAEVFMDAERGPDQTMSDIKFDGDRMSFIANDIDLIVLQRKN
jgi:hypothetical protein